MVLSTPPPADAHATPAEDWIERIDTALRLTRRGILVLVDRAQPWRLRDVVRALLPAHPELDVYVDPRGIEHLPAGSTLVLVPRSTDADRLNMARPLFSRRDLKVILFCERETSEALAYGAPDFFDWISIYIECPQSAPSHGVRGIRSALAARAPAMIWLEAEFEKTEPLRKAFDEALPGRDLVEMNPRAAFGEIVEVIRRSKKAWLWARTGFPILMRRTRWALGEAGRRSRAILVIPRPASVEAIHIPKSLLGFVPVHDAVLPIEKGHEILAAAGAMHPGRLAALTGCEPEAVALCAALLRHGEGEGALIDALLAAGDPGASVAIRALQTGLLDPQGIEKGEAPPPLWRALAASRAIRDFLSDPGAATLPRKAGTTAGALALQAFRLGDYNAGMYWAERSIHVNKEDEATALEVRIQLGEALFAQSEAEAALTWLHDAVKRMPGAEHPLFVATMHSLACALAKMDRIGEAQRTVGDALALVHEKVGLKHLSASLLCLSIAEILRRSFRIRVAEMLLRRLLGNEFPGTDFSEEEAERVVLLDAERLFPESAPALREWWRTAPPLHEDRWLALRDLGEVLVARARFKEAKPFLEQALVQAEARFGPEHPLLHPLLKALAQVATEAGRIVEAERLGSRAMAIESLCFAPARPPLTSRERVPHKAAVSVESMQLRADALGIRLAEPASPPPGTLPHTGGPFIELSHELVQALTDDERLVLHAACLFEPSRVPSKALWALFDAQGWDNNRFERAADALHSRMYILPMGDALWVHPSTAEFIRAHTEPVLPDAICLLHLERFAEAAAELSADPANAQRIARFVAYPVTLSLWEALGPTVVAQLGRYAHSVGVGLVDIGSFDQALPWLERAVQEKQQGDIDGRIDHDSLGRSLHRVGYCYARSERFGQALPWLERAVQEKQRGDMHGRVDHDSLGRSLHQIGACHSSFGRFDQALPWFERAVQEKQQGDLDGRIDHHSLGKSLHQVGYCHSSSGRVDQALRWFERAVVEMQQGNIHGRIDHDSLGKSLHQVGYCHASSGRFRQALRWFERAVSEAQQGDVHGRIDHDSLGVSQAGLAEVRRRLGREDAQ